MLEVLFKVLKNRLKRLLTISNDICFKITALCSCQSLHIMTCIKTIPWVPKPINVTSTTLVPFRQ